MVSTVINNKSKSYKKTRNSYGNSRKYPKQLVYAFRHDYSKCEIFYKAMYAYSHGRHILELSPLYIYELQNSVGAKRKALNNLFRYEDAFKLNFSRMPENIINTLAETAYNAIYQGLNIKLKSLDLNYFMSAEKIINAGNVIKNHNGSVLYGGSTIRDFLTHYLVNEKSEEFSDDQNAALDEFIKDTAARLKKYNEIKSIPFSIFRYNLYIRTNEEKEITTPDIEAKHNLMKIIGIEDYLRYNISKISMARATSIESKLIKQIRKTAAKEMNALANQKLMDIPEGRLKDDAIVSASIENVVIVTNSGLIHDIVDYMSRNLDSLVEISSNPSKILTEEQKKSLFQIEYTAWRTKGESDALWLSDIAEAIKAKYVTFEKILLCIDYKFAPIINNKSVLDYDISYLDLVDFYMDNIKDRTEEYINENMNGLLMKLTKIITERKK